MEIDPNEKVAADFLAERGFQCVRFSEEDIGKGPTPDFRVLKGTEFCFYCEVKSIDKERWLDEQLEEKDWPKHDKHQRFRSSAEGQGEYIGNNNA